MTTTMRTLALTLAIASAAPLLGCGKKGPPLPPLAGSKPRVTDLELRQVGNSVHATFSLPVPAGSETVDYQTKGVELWRRVVPEDEASRPAPPPPRRVGPPGASDEDDIGPGIPVKELTSASVLAVSISGQDLFDLLASPAPELVDRLPSDLLGRQLEYGLVLKTSVKSGGTVSDLVRFTPVPPPAPPTDVVATTVEGAVRVTWTPAKDDEGRPVPVNVYKSQPGMPAPPRAVGEKPIASPPWEDPQIETGATYRYELRSAQQAKDATLESEPAPAVTATYSDTFPPAVPEGLRAFGDSGRITLIWTPNDERDLLGYRVYRRAGGGAWESLTPQPLPSATFTDSPGPGAHDYAVTSLDRALPPNESAKSAPVTADASAP